MRSPGAAPVTDLRICGSLVPTEKTPASECPAERSKEVSYVLCQSSRLLHGGEVSALGHLCPLTDVGVVLFGNGARGTADLARKCGVACRHIDSLASWNGPWPVKAVSMARKTSRWRR